MINGAPVDEKRRGRGLRPAAGCGRGVGLSGHFHHHRLRRGHGPGHGRRVPRIPGAAVSLRRRRHAQAGPDAQRVRQLRRGDGERWRCAWTRGGDQGLHPCAPGGPEEGRHHHRRGLTPVKAVARRSVPRGCVCYSRRLRNEPDGEEPQSIMPDRFSAVRLAAAAFAVMLAASAPSSAQSTAETMRDVYGALADMLPVALDQQAFESREGIERMGGALDVLEHAASDLASHGGEASAEFTGLARSFESNIALLRQSLDMERYYEFNYLVLDLTHNCASCHARLPAGSGPAFAADL